ncbi:hypothetical protein MMC28_011451 [Mycoblastus sanguinarius]|nr:hypothetical protein [Mycoblastus sanguinarius]
MANNLSGVSYYRFIQETPSLLLEELAEDDRECFICREQYDTQIKPWQFGSTMNYPVALPCGHHVGLQRLARWILSLNFDNHCSICRTKVIGKSKHDRYYDRSNIINGSFFLAVLAMYNSCNTFARKEKLLKAVQNINRNPETAVGASEPGDRVMILFEEYLGLLMASVDTLASDRLAAGIPQGVLRVAKAVEMSLHDAEMRFNLRENFSPRVQHWWEDIPDPDDSDPWRRLHRWLITSFFLVIFSSYSNCVSHQQEQSS